MRISESKRELYRTMLLVALPVAVQNLLSQLVTTADNVMVSSLGDAVFAGVFTSNSATNFFASCISGLAAGASVLIAQYWGKKDMERIRSLFSITLSICIGFALCTIGGIAFFPAQVLRVFARDADVIQSGMTYFRIVCFSYLPLAIASGLCGMLRAVEVVKVTLYAVITALVTNLFFNWVLIFGHLGFPALGAPGAAIATVISRVCECAIVVYYALRVQKRLPLQVKDLLKTPGYLWRDFGRYGLPVALGDAQWALVGLVKMVIVGRLGAVMISAYGVAENLLSLGMTFTFALSVGASVAIGKTVGEKQYDRTREYSVAIQKMFFGVGIVMAGLVFLVRGLFVGMYGNLSDEARALALLCIGVGAIPLIGTTYHASCFMGINRGAGDSRFVFFVDMICGWLIVLPLSYLAAFVFKLPLHIVFLTIRIDQCFKWIIALVRLRGNRWIRNVTRD